MTGRQKLLRLHGERYLSHRTLAGDGTSPARLGGGVDVSPRSCPRPPEVLDMCLHARYCVYTRGARPTHKEKHNARNGHLPRHSP
jgi:hypothetical protein